MSVNLSPVAGAAAQFLDNSGNVLTGGKLYTYAAGTTTPQATYTSSAGVTFHSNPIILDAAGRVPAGGEIWLTDGVAYKFVLKDANDVLIATWDNLSGINSNFVNYTVQEEIQTATAGQTVFTLTTMSYSVGTNSLTVYVDGVNQYDGIAYAFVETDSTTVTFTAGLHVGALVKFTTAISNSSGIETNASLVAYDPPFTGSVATTVENKLAQIVSVKDFGAVGDGVTDDTLAIQAAINWVESQGSYIDDLINNYGSVYFPKGEYLVTGLTVTKPIALYSDNRETACLSISADATLLTIDTSTFTTPSGLDLNYQGPEIRHLTFKGSLTGSSQNGIVLQGKPGVYRIDQCNIQYFGNIGVHVIGIASLIFTGNQVQQNVNNAGLMVDGNGFAPTGYITASEISGNFIRRNKIGADLRGIISTTKIQNNVIEANTQGSGSLGSTTRPGIGLKLTKVVGGTGFQAFTDGAIEDNYFEFHWNDIYAEGMANTTVNGNYFDGSIGAITTYSIETTAQTPYGHIVLQRTNVILQNVFSNNHLSIFLTEVATGQWSIIDATTIEVSATFYDKVVRYGNGNSYVFNGTTGVLQNITAASIVGSTARLTVASTSGFDTAQLLSIYAPQISGANGTPLKNVFRDNIGILPTNYVDPDGVYDGQSIPVGLRSVRQGASTLSNYAQRSTNMTYYGNVGLSGAAPLFRLTREDAPDTSDTYTPGILLTGPPVANLSGNATFIQTKAGGVSNQLAFVNKNGDFCARAKETSNGGQGIAGGGVAFRAPAGNIVYHYVDSAVPTTATHRIGSIVFNSSPTSGQPIFWVCTVSGTPGTWVAGPTL